jgi:lysozyme family protein
LVLLEEGGLVDNPKDPGGLTNFGISQRAYPNVNIRGLTAQNATEIYRRDYWPAAHGEELPWPLCLFALDHAVNAGPAGAIRILQRELGLAVDGVFGPATRNALASRGPEAMQALAERFVVGRIRYYLSLPTAETFGVGWCGRVARIALRSGYA